MKVFLFYRINIEIKSKAASGSGGANPQAWMSWPVFVLAGVTANRKK